MARILIYTSPARGHLYPLVPTLEELRRRGHDLVIYTYDEGVRLIHAVGLNAEPIAPEIELVRSDDWRARTRAGALRRAVRVFHRRAQNEIVDLQKAIVTHIPDLILIDVSCWGASAVAEASGFAWAHFTPFFLPIPSPDVPPVGFGLLPRGDLIGRLRDMSVRTATQVWCDVLLPPLNGLRRQVGLAPFRHITDFFTCAPQMLSFTAEPFERRAKLWPRSITLVGPGLWDPKPAEPLPLPDNRRPLVLISTSSEFQQDQVLVQAALDAFAFEPVEVVVTTPSVEPARFLVPPNAIVRHFYPHRPLLQRAACVVCHGGMGITQKALAAGVPICAVPFGRDQAEVAGRVVRLDAGTRLSPRKLTSRRLRDVAYTAMASRAGAIRVATAFRTAGGPTVAADALEVGLAVDPSAVQESPAFMGSVRRAW